MFLQAQAKEFESSPHQLYDALNIRKLQWTIQTVLNWPAFNLLQLKERPPSLQAYVYLILYFKKKLLFCVLAFKILYV